LGSFLQEFFSSTPSSPRPMFPDVLI
jgi:hypothetical protein